jgi:hypothetical protein
MLKQTLVFTNPFGLSLRNAQLVIASKEMSEDEGCACKTSEILYAEQRQIKYNNNYRQAIFRNNKHLG